MARTMLRDREMRSRPAYFSAASLLCLLGCGPSPDTSVAIPVCSGAAPTYSANVRPIVVGRCSGGDACHAFSPISAMLELGPNMPVRGEPAACAPGLLVAPGEPSQSYLMKKITGTGMCPSTARMPLGGPPLSATDTQAIADWICSGALAN
jgi:hypothetical protein